MKAAQTPDFESRHTIGIPCWRRIPQVIDLGHSVLGAERRV
jgi:hypothetical protein